MSEIGVEEEILSGTILVDTCLGLSPTSMLFLELLRHFVPEDAGLVPSIRLSQLLGEVVQYFHVKHAVLPLSTLLGRLLSQGVLLSPAALSVHLNSLAWNGARVHFQGIMDIVLKGATGAFMPEEDRTSIDRLSRFQYAGYLAYGLPTLHAQLLVAAKTAEVIDLLAAWRSAVRARALHQQGQEQEPNPLLTHSSLSWDIPTKPYVQYLSGTDPEGRGLDLDLEPISASSLNLLAYGAVGTMLLPPGPNHEAAVASLKDVCLFDALSEENPLSHHPSVQAKRWKAFHFSLIRAALRRVCDTARPSTGTLGTLFHGLAAIGSFDRLKVLVRGCLAATANAAQLPAQLSQLRGGDYFGIDAVHKMLDYFSPKSIWRPSSSSSLRGGTEMRTSRDWNLYQLRSDLRNRILSQPPVAWFDKPLAHTLLLGMGFTCDAIGVDAVLQAMWGYGLEPDGETALLVYAGLAQAGDIQGAEAVWEDDRFRWGTSDWEQCILPRIQRTTLRLTGQLHSQLPSQRTETRVTRAATAGVFQSFRICGLVRVRRIFEAVQILETLATMGIIPLPEAVTSVLEGTGCLAAEVPSPLLLEVMTARETTPLVPLKESQRPEKARFTSVSSDEEAWTFNHARRLVTRVESCVRRLVCNGFRPRVWDINAAIRMYGAVGKLAAAEALAYQLLDLADERPPTYAKPVASAWQSTWASEVWGLNRLAVTDVMYVAAGSADPPEDGALQDRVHANEHTLTSFGWGLLRSAHLVISSLMHEHVVSPVVDEWRGLAKESLLSEELELLPLLPNGNGGDGAAKLRQSMKKPCVKATTFLRSSVIIW